MAGALYELALFEQDAEGGIRLVGRLTDPALVAQARERIVVQRRAELSRLARDGDVPRLRLARDEDPDRDGGPP